MVRVRVCETVATRPSDECALGSQIEVQARQPAAAPGVRSGAPPVAESCGDRATLRLPDHQFHGGYVDRRARPHRVCSGGHPEDDPGAQRRTEPVRMAGGEPLRAAREHHGPHLVQRTFWFFATHLHLHPRRQLGRPHSRRRHHRVGTSDVARLRDRSAVLPRRQRRPQHDAGDGAGVLRLLDRVGASGNRPGGRAQGTVRAQGRNDRAAEGAHDGRVLCGRVPGDRLDPVPAGVAQLPSLRQRLRGREHARNHGHDCARAWDGCCRSRSTSWNCWSVSCRRWSSCC